MGWVNTGFRRSLKISVLRQEVGSDNITYPDVTTVYNGQAAFGNFPALSDVELQQLPLTGTTGWNSRVSAFQSLLSSEHPEITGITWSDARIGVDAAIILEDINGDNYNFRAGLFKRTQVLDENGDPTGDVSYFPVNSVETIRIEVRFVTSSTYPITYETKYLYILNNTSESVIPKTISPQPTFETFYFMGFETVIYNNTGVYTNTPYGTLTNDYFNIIEMNSDNLTFSNETYPI